MLHSFGYEEARLAFSEAAKTDPSCAIAHWGVARSWYHPIWAPPSPDELKQGTEAIHRAVAAGAKTERERDYINALAVLYKNWQTVDHTTRAKAYEQALADVRERHPGDDEAAIFYALQLVAIGYLDPTDKTYAWQKKGGEILNQLLPRHQNHPGVAHYIIHSVDYPSIAELGLNAARAYAKIAPDSPHALHMPAHTFTRLGLWGDSIASNIASAKSAVAQARRLRGGGGSFDQLHAIDYLIYADLQQAQIRAPLKPSLKWQRLLNWTRTSSRPPTHLPPRRPGARASRLEGRCRPCGQARVVSLATVPKRRGAGALWKSDRRSSWRRGGRGAAVG